MFPLFQFKFQRHSVGKFWITVTPVSSVIKSGIESGDIIRVPRAGASGSRGVPPGDLDIQVQVLSWISSWASYEFFLNGKTECTECLDD